MNEKRNRTNCNLIMRESVENLRKKAIYFIKSFLVFTSSGGGRLATTALVTLVSVLMGARLAGLDLITSSSLLTQSTLELKFWHMK